MIDKEIKKQKSREKRDNYVKNYRIKNRDRGILYLKQYMEKNKEVRKVKSIIKKYGVSKEEYNSLLLAQSSCCAICSKPIKSTLTKDEINFKDKAIIDHNHKTNKIRGLLCDMCNKGIGCLNDDVNILKLAIIYLTKYSE